MIKISEDEKAALELVLCTECDLTGSERANIRDVCGRVLEDNDSAKAVSEPETSDLRVWQNIDLLLISTVVNYFMDGKTDDADMLRNMVSYHRRREPTD